MSNWEWWKAEEPKKMNFTMEQYEQERANTVSITRGTMDSDPDLLWDSCINITSSQLDNEGLTVEYDNDIVYNHAWENAQQELDLKILDAQEVPNLEVFFTELNDSLDVTLATNGFVVRVNGYDGENYTTRTFILHNISQVAEMFENARRLVKNG
jgi:hypothetical protein